MLCSIEIGTTKSYAHSQQHYFVVAETLERAMALAISQVVTDYPDEEDEAKDWVVTQARIKSVDNPLIDVSQESSWKGIQEFVASRG